MDNVRLQGKDLLESSNITPGEREGNLIQCKISVNLLLTVLGIELDSDSVEKPTCNCGRLFLELDGMPSVLIARSQATE